MTGRLILMIILDLLQWARRSLYVDVAKIYVKIPSFEPNRTNCNILTRNDFYDIMGFEIHPRKKRYPYYGRENVLLRSPTVCLVRRVSLITVIKTKW